MICQVVAEQSSKVNGIGTDVILHKEVYIGTIYHIHYGIHLSHRRLLVFFVDRALCRTPRAKTQVQSPLFWCTANAGVRQWTGPVPYTFFSSIISTT